MSTESSGPVKYTCYHDHTQLESCSGHTLEVKYSHTSDIVTVYVDGQSIYGFDPGQWEAMVEAWALLGKEGPGQ